MTWDLSVLGGHILDSHSCIRKLQIHAYAFLSCRFPWVKPISYCVGPAVLARAPGNVHTACLYKHACACSCWVVVCLFLGPQIFHFVHKNHTIVRHPYLYRSPNVILCVYVCMTFATRTAVNKKLTST